MLDTAWWRTGAAEHWSIGVMEYWSTEIYSRKDAKGAKAGDRIKVDLFTGDNGDEFKNFVSSVLSCQTVEL
jgi:hypothetical protein